MLQQLERDGCVYQDDAVDYLTRANAPELLRENADGNEVLGRDVLDAFKALAEKTVVWVRVGFLLALASGRGRTRSSGARLILARTDALYRQRVPLRKPG